MKGLSTELLKYGGMQFAIELTNLLQIIMEKEVLLKDWKMSIKTNKERGKLSPEFRNENLNQLCKSIC